MFHKFFAVVDVRGQPESAARHALYAGVECDFAAPDRSDHMHIPDRRPGRNGVQEYIPGKTAVVHVRGDQPSRRHENLTAFGFGADQQRQHVGFSRLQPAGEVESPAGIVEFSRLPAVHKKFRAGLNLVDVEFDSAVLPVGRNRHAAAMPGAVELFRLELFCDFRGEIVDLVVLVEGVFPDAGNFEVPPAGVIRRHVGDAGISREERQKLPEPVQTDALPGGGACPPGVVKRPQPFRAAAVRWRGILDAGGRFCFCREKRTDGQGDHQQMFHRYFLSCR